MSRLEITRIYKFFGLQVGELAGLSIYSKASMDFLREQKKIKKSLYKVRLL